MFGNGLLVSKMEFVEVVSRLRLKAAGIGGGGYSARNDSVLL